MQRTKNQLDSQHRTVTPRRFGAIPPALRVLGALLVTVASVEAVYLLAANIAIHRRLAAIASESQFDIAAAGRLLTLYPGDLRTDRVTMTIAEPPWRIETGPVRGTVKMLPLLLGAIHISELRARDVRIVAFPAGAGSARRSDSSDNPKEMRWASVDPAPPIMRLASSTRALRVDNVQAELDVLAMGPIRMHGPIRGTVTGFALPTATDPMELSLHWHDAALRLETPEQAGRSDGEVALKIAPKEDGFQGSWAERLTGDARLSGFIERIGDPSGARARALAERVRIHAAVALDRGLPSAGSYLEAEIGRVTIPFLRRVDFAARLPTGLEGLRVRVDVTSGADSGDAARGRVELQCDRIALSRENSDAWAATSARSIFELRRRPTFGVALTEGEVLVRIVEDVGDPTGVRSPLALRLTRSRALWWPGCIEAGGAVEMHGENAGILLDGLKLQPGARWMFAEMDNHPFKLELGVTVERSRAALESIVLEAGRMNAHGTMYVNSDGVLGALLIRRGELHFGVTFRGHDAQFQMSPDPGWLERTLEDLSAPALERLQCSAHAP